MRAQEKERLRLKCQEISSEELQKLQASIQESDNFKEQLGQTFTNIVNKVVTSGVACLPALCRRWLCVQSDPFIEYEITSALLLLAMKDVTVAISLLEYDYFGTLIAYTKKIGERWPEECGEKARECLKKEG